jgi:uncharacterized protein YjiS (DUF1127 family)
MTGGKTMNVRIDRAETVFLGSFASPRSERHADLAFAGGEAWQQRVLARVRDTLYGWAERSRARRELAALTDHELADIGLNRGDIDRVVLEGETR